MRFDPSRRGVYIYLTYEEADRLRGELVSMRVGTPMKEALWSRLMDLKALKSKKPSPPDGEKG